MASKIEVCVQAVVLRVSTSRAQLVCCSTEVCISLAEVSSFEFQSCEPLGRGLLHSWVCYTSGTEVSRTYPQILHALDQGCAVDGIWVVKVVLCVQVVSAFAIFQMWC